MSIPPFFSAPREAYGLSLAELEARYDLKSDPKGASIIPRGPLAGAGATTSGLITRITLAAQNQASLSKDPLIADLDFQHFSRTIAGAETRRSKIQRALNKLTALTQGCKGHSKEAIALKTSYWFEALLPSHPYGPDITDFFDAWRSARKVHYSFEDWLKLRPPSARPSSSVHYLTVEERIDFEASVREGKVFVKDAPLHTLKYASKTKPLYAIYVLTTDGKLYIGPYEVGKFHHSSFTAGQPVLGAGEIQTAADGTILSISSKSGHYKPTAQQLYNTFEYLKAHGVDLAKVELIENCEKGLKHHASIKDFIDSPKAGAGV